MTKFYCDICGGEITDRNFACSLDIAEVKDVYDVLSKSLNPKPQMMKHQFQICKTCYENNIVKLLKI